MATNDNLTNFLKGVADAIREKEGSSELINPQEFANRISLLAGGCADQVELIGNKLNKGVVGDVNTIYREETVLHDFNILTTDNKYIAFFTNHSNGMQYGNSYESIVDSITLNNHDVFITREGVLSILAMHPDNPPVDSKPVLCFIIALDPNDYLKFDYDYFYVAAQNVICFCKDTRISLRDGQTKLVQDIDYNDELLVWNFDECKFDKAKPLWIKKVEYTHSYYKVTFDDGSSINLVGSDGRCHRLFNYDDMVFESATELVGKRVHTINGIVRVKSVKKVKEECEYYNIITDYHMNCFANGVLASCRYNNLYPIVDMKFDKSGIDSNDGEMRSTKRTELSKHIPYKYIKGMRLDENLSQSIEDTIEYVRNIIRREKTVEDFEGNETLSTELSDIEVGLMDSEGNVYGLNRYMRGMNSHELIARKVCKLLDITTKDKSCLLELMSRGWAVFSSDYFLVTDKYDITEKQEHGLLDFIGKNKIIKKKGKFKLGNWKSKELKVEYIKLMSKKEIDKRVKEK